jgi:hypothetical protein
VLGGDLRTTTQNSRMMSLSSRKLQRGLDLGFAPPIENALVGPHGPKIADGTVEEVLVRYSNDDGYTAAACSSSVGEHPPCKQASKIYEALLMVSLTRNRVVQRRGCE